MWCPSSIPYMCNTKLHWQFWDRDIKDHYLPAADIRADDESCTKHLFIPLPRLQHGTYDESGTKHLFIPLPRLQHGTYDESGTKHLFIPLPRLQHGTYDESGTKHLLISLLRLQHGTYDESCTKHLFIPLPRLQHGTYDESGATHLFIPLPRLQHGTYDESGTKHLFTPLPRLHTWNIWWELHQALVYTIASPTTWNIWWERYQALVYTIASPTHMEHMMRAVPSTCLHHCLAYTHGTYDESCTKHLFIPLPRLHTWNIWWERYQALVYTIASPTHMEHMMRAAPSTCLHHCLAYTHGTYDESGTKHLFIPLPRLHTWNIWWELHQALVYTIASPTT